MKTIIVLITSLICVELFACNKNNEMTGSKNDALHTDSIKLKITVGSNTFTATFYDYETAKAFKARLPLTINMKELNGNEKYFNLPFNLPTNASNPGSIQAGDVMLFGSNTLVLFYKTFSTSYSYTRIARINNPSGLFAVLGSGNATVKFELE